MLSPRRVSGWSGVGLFVGCFLTVALLLWAARGHAAPASHYTLTDLGGGPSLFPTAIDRDSVTVVGSLDGPPHAVRLTPTVQRIASDGTTAQDVCGERIVGTGGGGGGFAFELVGTNPIEDLTPPGALTYRRPAGLAAGALAVNCVGTVVGWSFSAQGSVPTVWIGTQASFLPTLGGGGGQATAINQQGDIAGQSTFSSENGRQHCAFWPLTGGVVDCHTRSDWEQSAVTNINDPGQVVGYVYTYTPPGSPTPWIQQGFVWLPLTGMLLLPPLPGDETSVAEGINNAGDIIGSSCHQGQCQAVGWLDGHPYPLQPRLTNGAGWTVTSATDINNQGVIVGIGFSNGQEHAVLLTPTAPMQPVGTPGPTPLMAPVLTQSVQGDFDGDAVPDLAGIDATGGIWTCLAIWQGQCQHIYGWLSTIVAGDFDGNGRDDLAGIGVDNTIWTMTDGQTWQQVPGWALALVSGDFYGDGHAHLAAIGGGYTIWRSPRLGQWEQLPGWLSVLVAGDFDGDGRDDLAGIGLGSTLWLFRNGQYWEGLPGWLLTMDVEHTAAGHDALVGWNGACWYRMETVGVWEFQGCGAQIAQQ